MVDEKKKNRRRYVVFPHKMDAIERRFRRGRPIGSPLVAAFAVEAEADSSMMKRVAKIAKEFAEK
jgi:hypothetical protein